MYELVDEKRKDEFYEIDEKYRPEKHDEMLSFLQQAYAGITADSQRVKENIETETLFDGENGVDLLGGITDDTVYTVYVEHCSREKTTDGSNIYMFCSLIIDTAEKEYVMPNVCCWIVNGQCGVWIDDSMQTQTIHAEIKGKTASEIYEMLK